METRFITRAAKRLRIPSGPHPSLIQHIRASSSSSPASSASVKPPSEQAIPLGGYYSSILSNPAPTYTLNIHTPVPVKSPPPSPSSSSTTIETNLASAPPIDPSILFSSRTVKLRERREDITKQSTIIAGVRVPPKPTEPDDCCMSGCVNCVWDRYGEEMEEWVAAKNQADIALAKEGKKGGAVGDKLRVDDATQTSMDDDGGGSSTNWGTGLETGFTAKEDLFKNVPVGIREFMRLEKSLKEKQKEV